MVVTKWFGELKRFELLKDRRDGIFWEEGFILLCNGRFHQHISPGVYHWLPSTSLFSDVTIGLPPFPFSSEVTWRAAGQDFSLILQFLSVL